MYIVKRDWVVKTAYLVIAVCILILAYLSIQNYRRITLYSNEIDTRTKQRTLINESFDIFKDIESSTRGYLLLGDGLLLINRTNALERHQQNEINLIRSFNGQPFRQAKYRQISTIYHHRMLALKEALKTTDTNKKQQILMSSADVINEAGVAVDKMIDEQDAQLIFYNHQLQDNFAKAPLIVFGLTGLIVTFLLLNYRYLSTQLKLARKLADSLLDTNKALEDANASYLKTQSLLDSILKVNPNGIIAYEALRSSDGQIYDFKVTFATGHLKVLKSSDNAGVLVGKRVSELYPKLVGNGFFDLLREIIETGKGKSMDYFYNDNNIEPSWFELHITPLMDGVLLNGRDITKFKQNEKELVATVQLLNQRNLENEKYVTELKKSNEQLRQITHVASHDLQEPLRKLQVFASRINENHIEKITPREITRIKDSAAHMSDLLLAITRYTHLVMSGLQIQIVDLNMLLNQVFAELRQVIDSKEAEISVDKLPVIQCDPIQITRLFVNLFDNALKFNKNKPVITLNCERVDSSVADLGLREDFFYYKFTLTDNGIGFKNDYNKKIFEIFEKLHNNDNYPGVGIGLAKCHKIVENHFGQIAAYSAISKGSTFVFYLPGNLKLNGSPVNIQKDGNATNVQKEKKAAIN